MSNVEQEQNKNTLDDQVSQSDIVEKEKQEIQDVDILDPRDEKIFCLEAKLLQLQQQERDSILRAKAEIENIRRRSEQNMQKAHKFALEHFVSELLPIIDNLERALGILSSKNVNVDDNNVSNDVKDNAIVDGIQLTYKSFLDVMHKFGVEIISEVNVPFNPDIHQAMVISESKDYDPNVVIMIIQKGYILNGRLIRPAMVTVTKNESL